MNERINYNKLPTIDRPLYNKINIIKILALSVYQF